MTPTAHGFMDASVFIDVGWAESRRSQLPSAMRRAAVYLCHSAPLQVSPAHSCQCVHMRGLGWRRRRAGATHLLPVGRGRRDRWRSAPFMSTDRKQSYTCPPRHAQHLQPCSCWRARLSVVRSGGAARAHPRRACSRCCAYSSRASSRASPAGQHGRGRDICQPAAHERGMATKTRGKRSPGRTTSRRKSC